MKRVATYAKDNKFCKEAETTILNLLKENHFNIDNNDPEVVIVIGGDGTFLRAVHHYLDKVIFIGLNAGHLGFFSEFELEEINELISVLKEDKFGTKSYRLINAIVSSDKESKAIYAVNEVRIENPFRTLIADVFINDHMLESFRGNGLVVCTPVGSSAYNKSLGGAIIDTSLEVLELTEIAGIQNNVYRSIGAPYILNGNTKITFEGSFDEVVVGYDFETIHLDHTSKIEITLSDKSIRLIDHKHFSHFDKIKGSFIE